MLYGISNEGGRRLALPPSRIISVFTALISLAMSTTGWSGTFPVFGAQAYERGRGEPDVVTSTFSVPSLVAPYYIELENGPGGSPRVSSAVVTINGAQVISPEDMNQQVGRVERPVMLGEHNEIAVELRGTPFGRVLVTVFGIDNDPPRITANVSPEPNQYGWNNTDVRVTFECGDDISGIAACSDPVDVSQETAGEQVTGTALDNAGNTAQVSITVRLDKTAPVLSRSWPPSSEFSTDRASIDIEGRVTDALAGIGAALLEDSQGTRPLADPDFTAVGLLDTDIAAGEFWTENLFALYAEDRAGNAAQQSFLVRYTEGAHVLPTDPSRTELFQGLPTSVDRAIVRFDPSVARADIDDVVGQVGGRVVGFLPATNTAIVAFETDLVVDLNNLLGSLRDRTDVVSAAVPAVFVPEIDFDNDDLSAVERASYDNIRSSETSQFVIDNGLSLAPVNIAVIETGLDDSYGENAEFADVRFYDLCTPEGQAGQTGTPVDTGNAHGTKITGILAGASNGYGNNGVISGIAGSQFTVHVFRMNCGSVNDPGLIIAAMDLIIGGSLGDFHVVNMSFGGLFADPTLRDDVRAIYEGYFDGPTGQEILWVGGAGNDNQEIACNEFLPSGLACALDNVVSVGGYNASDLLRGIWIGSTGTVFGSNWGDGVTISAPGTDVWTATGPGTYGPVSGTSASTPLVSGAAALTFAAVPLSPSAMKQLLINEAQPLADPMLPEGGIDMLASLQAALPRVVYDNGASTHSGGSAVGHFIAADDFVLTAATDVLGASVDVSDGPAAENRRWDGTVEWWLFYDNAGVPGNLIASGTGQNIQQSDVVESVHGFRDFTVEFDFGAEIALPAGQTFWLGLHMQTDYSRVSVFWDHQGSTVGHPSRSGGELIGGAPNFVDGEFAGTSAFDKAFRLWGRPSL